MVPEPTTRNPPPSTPTPGVDNLVGRSGLRSEPFLSPRVGECRFAFARAVGQRFDPYGVDTQGATLLSIRVVPGTVVEPPLDEHRGSGAELLRKVFGLFAEYRDPLIPGKVAGLPVVPDDMVTASKL